jgi:hypothetical protein
VGQESLAEANEVAANAIAATRVVMDLWEDKWGSVFIVGSKLSVCQDNVGKEVLVSNKYTFARFGSLWNGLR